MVRNYNYDSTWADIEEMLHKAEREAQFHLDGINSTQVRPKKMMHMRNYKALQGVINALRWTLGDPTITEEELLGRD